MKRNSHEAAKDSPLQVRVEGGQLQINIGIDTLASCAERSDFYSIYDPAIKDWNLKYKVRDHLAFATVVSRILQDEIGEDGTTKITSMLDQAFILAAEDCDSSIEEITGAAQPSESAPEGREMKKRAGMFEFGGLIDAWDLLPNDCTRDDLEQLGKWVNSLREWVADYFEPEARKRSIEAASSTSTTCRGVFSQAK